MVEFLHSWLVTNQGFPAVPRGIFAGARRFLQHALEGIALNRHERSQPDVPIMAGISNLTIARAVFHQLPSPPGKLEEIEEKVKQFLQALKDFEDQRPRSPELVRVAEAMQQFFHELQQQGHRARHAAFARAEAPRP
jgi:hypothetical protein